MWTCPQCDRTFANRNQTHTCARLGELERHFAGSAPVVRATFDRLLAVVSALGPFDVLSEKTRIALHARMSFVALMPRRSWLAGHLVLAREIRSPRFTRIDAYSPRNVVHQFKLCGFEDVDEEFAAWLGEAYDVGIQKHARG
jgi:hypothetical protein